MQTDETKTRLEFAHVGKSRSPATQPVGARSSRQRNGALSRLAQGASGGDTVAASMNEPP